MTFLLAEPEKQLLRAIAARLPFWVASNHLTAVGVAGAVGAGVAYAVSTLNPAWLWISSLMLAINWFGDSLDGTLARVRRAERPNYGYYLDHNVDAFSTAAIGIGIGLSPFLRLDLALLLVVLYLALSINVYLESLAFGVFRMAYGRLGPTEVRIILILANTIGFLGARQPGVSQELSLVANGAAATGTVAMLAMLAIRFGRNLHRLATLEPERRPHPGTGTGELQSPALSR
ncbi:MAG: CDP-alcohol phosphatidyltransferase family protein [Gemmatimonadetes bacterium]|nr:CDP-alcohol phosphatidyltransferase family protein [Gemmatimonadota bacterium]